VSIGRAQCVFGGSMPQVAQSSNTVWSNVPGLTEALNCVIVRANACASILNAPASSASVCARTGGKTGGMNLPIDFTSMMA
jgi:hypothetical protein